MNLLTALAVVMSVLAATACYLASPNGLWRSTHVPRRWMRSFALLLCLLSLAAWIDALGTGVGLCAMLGTGMLTMIVLPWIALRTSSTMSSMTRGND